VFKVSQTGTRSRDPRPVCNTANRHAVPTVNPTHVRAMPKASAVDSGSSRAGWSLTERVLAAAQLSHAGACNDSVVPTVDAFGHTLFRNSSSDTITSRVPVYRSQEAAPQNANQANPCGLAEPLRPADELDLDAVLEEIVGEAPAEGGVVYSDTWDEIPDMATGLQPFAEVPQWLANVGPLVPDLGCVSFADMW
jgi:hypothetical protein